MSTSLDKLKALTNKLDGKLTEKSKTTSSYKEKSIPNSVREVIDLSDTTQEEEVENTNSDIIDNPEMCELATDKKSKITVLVKSETAEDLREKNIARVKELYNILKIYEKSPDFSKIFMYKAMNLSGIGLKDDDFGTIRAGKYIQIIAITYEPDANGKKKAKNISLGYFGKGETIDPELKNNIIEFVLCWRYEKAFQNVEHYKNLLAMIDRKLKEEIVAFK